VRVGPALILIATLAALTCVNSAAAPASVRGYCSTAPPGTLPLSDQEAAERALQWTLERRPENTSYNAVVPSDAALAAFRSESAAALWFDNQGMYDDNVSGRLAGVLGRVPVTDEIISWVACKWGLDEDTIRAVLVHESDWRQTMRADVRPCVTDEGGASSLGIAQVKGDYPGCVDGWRGVRPLNRDSTAWNLDYYASRIRACLDGAVRWWPYWPGDVWGCVGWWFSGGWHDPQALRYVAVVQGHLANRTWLQYPGDEPPGG
jgi:hypothetical protein